MSIDLRPLTHADAEAHGAGESLYVLGL